MNFIVAFPISPKIFPVYAMFCSPTALLFHTLFTLNFSMHFLIYIFSQYPLFTVSLFLHTWNFLWVLSLKHFPCSKSCNCTLVTYDLSTTPFQTGQFWGHGSITDQPITSTIHPLPKLTPSLLAYINMWRHLSLNINTSKPKPPRSCSLKPWPKKSQVSC